MGAFVNLRVLLYLLVSFVFHPTSSETFTSARTSFLQLKRWNMSDARCLRFRFKTFLPDALLLYMDDEGNTNFLRLELIQGKLRLTCSYGSRFGPMADETRGKNLNDLVWHRVLVERNKDNTTIYLDDLPKLAVESREKKGLIVKSPMYFGGFPPNLGANRVTEPSVLLLNRFIGCIMDSEFLRSSSDQGNKIIKTIVENSDEVIPGCIDECEKNNTCINNGTCLNRFITTACDCTTTGYRGGFCERALPVIGLSRSDYLVFNRSNKAVSSKHDRITLRFKTANQNGTLLESGRWVRDYLVVALSDGYILIRWNLGSGEMNLHARDKMYSDNNWHSVDIRRNRGRIRVTIDGVFHVSRSFPGNYQSFDLEEGEGDVYFGGMVTNGFPTHRRPSSFPFEGCLQEINFNGLDIIQGFLDKKDAFISRGSPKFTCDIPKGLIPTTAAITPLVTMDRTISANKVQRPTSYTTPRKMTTNIVTDKSQRLSTSKNKSKSSKLPCTDDEDNCDPDDSGSGENEISSEESGYSGDNYISPGSESSTKGKHIISGTGVNTSKNKSIKSKATGVESKGESDNSLTPCPGDDEDACENSDESGQGSAEQGSAAGSTNAPSPRTFPNGNGEVDVEVKERALVKENGSKKWTLIAGIIVVGTLLITFCIFAIWWLWKNKKNPEWTGVYQVNGSRERCLAAEGTDV